MGAAGHEAAAVEDGDAVGPASRCDALGDEDAGGAGVPCPEGLVEGGLRLHVEGAGAVVEDEELGAPEEGPGEGDALLLPAGEARAPLGHLGIVARGLREDKVLRLGDAGGLLDFLLRGLHSAHADIFPEGGLEELRLLEGDGDAAAELPQGIVSDIDAIQQDAALCHIVEPEEERRQSALAGARGPHDGEGLPRLEGEGDVRQGRALGPRVGEAHLLEGEAAPSLWRALRVAAVTDGGGEGDHLPQAGVGGKAPDENLKDHGEHEKPDEDLGHVGGGGHDGARSHLLQLGLLAAHLEDSHDGEAQHHIGKGRQHGDEEHEL